MTEQVIIETNRGNYLTETEFNYLWMVFTSDPFSLSNHGTTDALLQQMFDNQLITEVSGKLYPTLRGKYAFMKYYEDAIKSGKLNDGVLHIIQFHLSERTGDNGFDGSPFSYSSETAKDLMRDIVAHGHIKPNDSTSSYDYWVFDWTPPGSEIKHTMFPGDMIVYHTSFGYRTFRFREDEV